MFSERYAPTLILDESHLLEVHRYVVLNPVASGLCASPDDWRSSSYRATAGLGAVPGFLAVDSILTLFGEERRQARKRYRAFVAEGIATRRPPARPAA